MADAIAAFRAPPDPYAGAAPLLASMLLAMDLCTAAEQLRQWWAWPPHREARGQLEEAEALRALAHYESRLNALDLAAAPRQPPATPPAMIQPAARHPLPSGRLL